jgi:hypothetical protein
LSAFDGVGTPQSRMGRHVGGRVAEQYIITALVGIVRSRVLPGGTLAWRVVTGKPERRGSATFMRAPDPTL